MVLAMIIAFFVCWLPYTTLSVVVVVDPELYIPPLLATMPMYFAKTSPVYNPIIYFLSNKQVSILSVFLLEKLQYKGLLCTKIEGTQKNALHVMLIYVLMVLMCLYDQQFRDATLEVLSCGRYIPHAPTRVSINMCSSNRWSQPTSLSRSVNMHSKVLPV